MEKIFQEKEYYAIQDKTNEDVLFDQIFQKKDAAEKLEKFYDFLKNNKTFTFIEFVPECMDVKTVFEYNDETEPLFFSKESPREMQGRDLYNIVNSISVGEDFFKQIGLETSGKLQKKNQVILGDAYRKFYQLHDKIEKYDLETEKEVELEVVGFLEKNSYFFSRSQGLILLDHYMFTPFSIQDGSKDDKIRTLDNLINQSLIQSKDIDKAFSMINKKSTEYHLYKKLLPLSMKEQGNSVLFSIKEYRDLLIPVLGCVIVFAFLSVGASIVNLLRKSIGEICVYLLCGANIQEIIMQYIYLNASLVLFPYLLSLGISKIILEQVLNIKVVNGGIEAGVLIVVLIFWILLSVLPIYYIKKMELADILKKEHSI